MQPGVGRAGGADDGAVDLAGGYHGPGIVAQGGGQAQMVLVDVFDGILLVVEIQAGLCAGADAAAAGGEGVPDGQAVKYMAGGQWDVGVAAGIVAGLEAVIRGHGMAPFGLFCGRSFG